MKRILLICTGNTCRSCMAEAILKSLLEKDYLNDIDVSSAGTYAIEGDKASTQAIIVMKEFGLSLEEHCSTSLSHDLIEAADLILTMTVNHKKVVLSIDPDAKEKVFTLKEYVNNPKHDIDNGDLFYSMDISDPFGQSVEIYRKCANEINDYLNKLLEKIEK